MADPAGPFTRNGEFFFTSPSTGGASSPASGTWKLGQIARDTSGALWVCTVAGSPGTWVAAGGSSSGPPFLGPGTVASAGVLRMANGGGSGVFWRNNANTGDIGWNVGAFDNIATQGTTALYVTAGGVRGTVEVMRVGNVAPAGDNAANSLFIPSATGAKPIVVQLLNGQTANAFEVQTYLGAIVASFTATGGLTAASIDAGSGNITTTGALKAGSNPAASGTLRLASTAQINWRNAANNADLGGFSSNASDQIELATDLVPSADNSKAFGSTSRRWSIVVSTIGTFGGTNPAATGTLRFPSAASMNWRNAANSGDIGGFSTNASDQLQAATTFVPSSDSAKDLGASGLRWANIYGVIGVFGSATNVASAGAVRLANGTVLNWRNAANSADLGWTVNGSNQMVTTAELVAPDLAPASTTGATVAARYFRGTTTGAPASGTWVAGDIVPGTDGTFWHCTAGGTPGTWVQSGSATYAPILITSTTQTTDYTPSSTDVGTVVEVSKSTVATITLPSSITAGSSIEFLQTGAGQLAFVPGSGVSSVVAGGGRRATAGQYSSAVARKRSDGTWHIAGDLVLYDPTSIAGLVYWFKGGGTYWQDSGRTTAATADGDPVGAWDDASTGVAHAIQATSGSRPVLKIGANGINSVPVVRFDGSDDFLASPASAATKPFTLFIVVRPSALPTTTNLAFPVGAATGGQGMYLDLNGKQGLDKTGTAAIGLSTSTNAAATVLIMEATYSNTGVYTYYKNGAADGTGTNNQTFSAQTLQIGKSAGDVSVGSFFTGDIAEIIKYDSVLAASDLQAVENYLGGKYSVTVT